jgi:hypothetical protein
MTLEHNVVILDNEGTADPIEINKVVDALVIKMGYESSDRLFNFFWNICKYLLRRTDEFDQAFKEFESKHI